MEVQKRQYNKLIILLKEQKIIVSKIWGGHILSFGLFSIKNNADGIIFLRNKLKVLWKKNNMDSNLLNTKVHHNH